MPDLQTQLKGSIQRGVPAGELMLHNNVRKRKTIVQLIGTFEGGGAERLAINLAGAIAGLGYRSVAMSMRGAGQFTEGIEADDVEVISLGVSGAGARSALCAIARLRTALRNCGADIVHVHGSTTILAAMLAVRTMRHAPSVYFTWHTSDSVGSRRWPRRILLRWAMRGCQAVTGSSRSVAERLNAVLDETGRSSVFVNGVPVTPANSGQNLDRATIIWAGRLVPTKDPEIFLRSLARLRTEGYEFRSLLAGAGLSRHAAYEGQVRDLREELGLSSRAQMPGWIDDLGDVIAQANIGVQSSKAEGLSMSLLEMMMAGLAVVATDVGDTACAIEHERSGLVVPPSDGDAFYSALERVVSDAKFRRQLGRAARERALDQYSTDAMARRAIEMYGL